MFQLSESLELVRYDNSVLHEPCHKFDLNNPPFDIVKFSVDLVEVMNKHNALGIAANQVGVPYRIFAMHCDPILVLINPKIVSVSEEQNYMIEGCLSYPKLNMKIKRPAAVEMRATHPNGLVKTHKFENLTAHVALHEYDHLDGKTYFDVVDRIHRESGERHWKAIKRKII